MNADLDAGRESFRVQAWGDAFARLSSADGASALGPDDLERLAVAAYLLGMDSDSAQAWARAFSLLADGGEAQRAARCAFWLAFELMNADEIAQAGGWLARASRLLEDCEPSCAERGFLLLPGALQALHGGDAQAGYRGFTEAAAVGDRFGDRDLMTLGRMGQGQALIALGRPAEGVGLLDEVMVGVAAGEVSPLVAGLAYCAVISACHELFDFRRAREWTAVLSTWCEAQPDLVPYRGQCLVHRSQVMQIHGAWSDALLEAQRACERLARPPGQAALGMAFYQRGELRRLRGEFVLAEQAYREANHFGHEPQPGLALLRLAQDRLDAAWASIRRAVDETRDPLTRTRRLPAYAEIALAAGDVAAARAAADELSGIAGAVGAAALRAVAGAAEGSVLLADGDPHAALQVLRQAWRGWQELNAPYDGARVRVLAGLACRALGDEDGAQMEFDAARRVFSELGAAPDVARVEGISGAAGGLAVGGLTAREAQVLGLVAAGKTNRAIASELMLSEKTVARHVSNIFTKLGVASRSAATAYAYKHKLI
ncbi:MAG TPA: helix-turn-helix transcriptional regulator [Streptosporangiaceae bacterium]|nr:helix-turn-helix transcriptional regulator [Streptosporangiaceae bacterium]